MRIVGFNFKKINCERKKDNFQGKLNVDASLNIEDLTKSDMDLFKKQDILDCSFEYKILYDPDFAEIVLKGNVLILLDSKDEKITNLLKDWKKKKLSEDFKTPIFNYALNKCNLKALQLESDFNFPPHIPLPRMSSKTKANYTG